jgi:3',5'-cyclic-AMP phosphodiesterase
MAKYIIAQISDLHIAGEGEMPYGVDVRKNFFGVLEDLARQSLDLLVVTGDLCLKDADAGTYGWIKEKIEKLNLPYRVIPGNHDDPVMMADIFAGHTDIRNEEVFYSLDLPGITAYFLDSSRNYLPQTQLDWLLERKRPGDNIEMFFMHHPPVLCGVPYMDNKYALENRKATCEALMQVSPHPIVFCGHYHVSRTVFVEGMRIFLSPACFFQIDENTDAFNPAHHMPAYRKISVSENRISTTVKYIV